MTDLKITEATVQLVVNEQEPVFLQVLRGPIVVSGGGGVTVHNDLTGRSDADTHPISSITGLTAALEAAGGSVTSVALLVDPANQMLAADGWDFSDMGTGVIHGSTESEMVDALILVNDDMEHRWRLFKVLPDLSGDAYEVPDVDNPIIANIAPMDVVLAGGPVPTNAFVLALNDFTTADYPALGRLYFIVGDKDGGPTDFYLLPVQPYSDGTQTAGPYDVLEAPNGLVPPLAGPPRHVAVTADESSAPGPYTLTLRPYAKFDEGRAWTVMYGAHSDPSLDNLTVVGVSNLSAIPRDYTAQIVGADGVGWFCDGLYPSATVPAGGGAVDSVNGQTGTVSLDLDDLTDVDTTTDPPDADDVLAWDGVTWTPATLTALGAPGLSNATPADLGTAAPGVSTEASRADHVHDLPTAADVGAAASLHVHSGADITSGTVAAARLGSGTADATTFLRGDSTWAAPPGGSSEVILPRVVGSYYSHESSGNGTQSHQANTVGYLCLHPVWLHAGNIDRAAVRAYSAGSSTWRLGLYPAHPTNWLPAGTSLIVDAGTISTASTGIIAASISASVPSSGWYWAAVLVEVQGANAGVWVVSGDSTAGPSYSLMPPHVHGVAVSDLRTPLLMPYTTGVATGSMPSTCPAASAMSSCVPRIGFRAAT